MSLSTCEVVGQDLHCCSVSNPKLQGRIGGFLDLCTVADNQQTWAVNK